MDNTTPEKKMQVSDKLRRLAGVVEALEAAGICVIIAEATTREDNVLVFAHDKEKIRNFQNWLRTMGLTAGLVEDPRDSGLNWTYTVQWHGVTLDGFLTDEEADFWLGLEAAE